MGDATMSPYADDAGLAAILAASPANHGEEIDLSQNPMVVDGAVVALIDAPGNNVWLGDAGAAVRVYDGNGTAFLNSPPGSVVSFQVIELSNYQGEPQISGITNLQNDGTAPVFVQDGTELSAFAYAEHGREVFSFHGEVLAVEACGNVDCAVVGYGDADDEVSLRMVTGALPGVGECVHAIVPLTRSGNALQWSVRNDGWWRTFVP
jgi:hypothetical protein